MVTPEGIILADPINAAFATWMKEQFAERFKVPVRYVIYSHSHWDHIEGGAVFADTARFIAHENVARNMDGRIPQMPGDMLDRNHNGRFELEEIVGPLNDNAGRCGMPASFFRTADRNGDGSLTPAELQTDIRRPDILYSDRMRLTLGGKTVELIYPGRNHSDDATVLYFPAERVVFATEFISDVALAGHRQSALVSQRLRTVRWKPALGMDSFLSDRRGSRLRHLCRRTRRARQRKRTSRRTGSSSKNLSPRSRQEWRRARVSPNSSSRSCSRSTRTGRAMPRGVRRQSTRLTEICSSTNSHVTVGRDPPFA